MDIMVMPKDPEKAALTRKRMSESAKKRQLSPEGREARKQAMSRPEVGAKISASQTVRLSNPEVRKAMSETAKIVLNRPEIKAKIDIGRIEGLNRPEVKAKRSEQALKRYAETDLRERISKATKEAVVEVQARPEFHEHLSDAMRKRWADPEQREIMLEAMRLGASTLEVQETWSKAMSKVHRNRDRSSIEVIVATLLSSLEIEYEEQKHIGRYVADFYVPGKNLVIECDGEYWHDRKPGAKEKDARKDVYLASHGYSILRLPEVEIKNKDFSVLLNTLL